MIVDCGGPIAAANDDDDRGLISLPGRPHQLEAEKRVWRWQRTAIGSPAPILWIVLDPRLVEMMMMMMLLAPVGRDREKAVPDLYVVVPFPPPVPPAPSPPHASP